MIANIHGHGPRCPCEFCAWRMRRATAAYWITRGVRRLAGIDPSPRGATSMTTDLRAALRDLCEAIEGNHATSSDRIAAYRALSDAPPTVAELLPRVDAGHEVRWIGVDGDQWRAIDTSATGDRGTDRRIDFEWRPSDTDDHRADWMDGCIFPADLSQPARLVEVTP